MPDEAEVRWIVEQSVGEEAKDQLFANRVSAESYLASADSALRCAALIAITYYWGPDDSFKKACERLVLGDPSPEVRKCALAALFGCYHETDWAGVGRTAALLVYDNSQLRQLRHDAYWVLFQLWLPRRTSVMQPLSPKAAGFRFPEDVDWKLVDSFLYGEAGRL